MKKTLISKKSSPLAKRQCVITLTEGRRENTVDVAFVFTPPLDMKDDSNNSKALTRAAFIMMEAVGGQCVPPPKKVKKK